MFTLALIFVGLLVYPFLLGPSIGFHRLKEEHRYQKPEKILASKPEAFFVKAFSWCFIFSFLYLYFLGRVSYLVLTIWMIVTVPLLVVYPFKILRSLRTNETISVLDLSLSSKAAKITVLIIIVLIDLSILENLHFINTYLR